MRPGAGTLGTGGRDGRAVGVGVSCGCQRALRRLQRRAAIERRLLRRVETAAGVSPSEVDPDLWDAVRSLPARQREAIVLRYVVDLEQHEIADAMGVTAGTVASTLHAARARLHTALGGADPDDELSEVE